MHLPPKKPPFRPKPSVPVPRKPESRWASAQVRTRPPNLSPMLRPSRMLLISVSRPSQRVLSVYAAYKLLDGVVATTNIGIQANKNGNPKSWPLRLSSVPRISSRTHKAGCEGAEKFTASQQVAEELMKRIQLGLETTATTQELVTGFQAIIAPRSRPGTPLKRSPSLLLVRRRLWALSRSRFSRCGQR